MSVVADNATFARTIMPSATLRLSACGAGRADRLLDEAVAYLRYRKGPSLVTHCFVTLPCCGATGIYGRIHIPKSNGSPSLSRNTPLARGLRFQLATRRGSC